MKINKAFYRKLLGLIIPITLQSLITQAVNACDVFMIGYCGQDELSAVSLANQLQFLVTGFFWGITSGISLMIAQYWGKGDRKAIHSVMGIGFKISFFFTLVISVLGIIFPSLVMRFFTPDENLIRIGGLYLRTISVTFLFQAVTQVYECSIRNMDRAGRATLISSVALIGNLFLNALFVFGFFGLPSLGVFGVALATVIARFLEMLLCLADIKYSKPMHYELRLFFNKRKDLFSDFLKFSLPAIFNDLSWTAAFSMYSVVLGHMGSDVVASSAVAATVRDLSTVLCMSLGSAAVAMIGQEIGSGNIQSARSSGRIFVLMSLLFGAITGLLILILRPVFAFIFPLTDLAKDYLYFMLLISSYYVIGQSVNTVIITGVFRAGGDTRFGMICDTVNMWLISLPVVFFSAFVIKLSPKTVYFILCLDEFYKIPFEYIHYKKYGWLNNITRS